MKDPAYVEAVVYITIDADLLDGDDTVEGVCLYINSLTECNARPLSEIVAC